MTLHDDKTGARHHCDSIAQARALAIDLGLKEYEITPDGMDPPTIRETAAAMRERGMR